MVIGLSLEFFGHFHQISALTYNFFISNALFLELEAERLNFFLYLGVRFCGTGNVVLLLRLMLKRAILACASHCHSLSSLLKVLLKH